MEYNSESHLLALDDVRDFFTFVVSDLGLDEFHPDDSFEDYIDTKNHTRKFSDAECSLYNRLLSEAFSVCEKADEDIYDLGWSIIEKYMMEF